MVVGLRGNQKSTGSVTLMFSRIFIGLTSVASLAACQPTPPDDVRFGTGFDQAFDSQIVNRPTIPEPAGVIATPLDGSAEATAAETTALLSATANNSGVVPVEANPANPAPPVVDAASGISRENNFDAVSDQRSIESDAARIAANRAQYQVIQPEALPERESTGPNIVAYALQTSHPVGTEIYKRFSLNAAAKYNRICSQYRHQDQAQIDFLAAGGPERDRLGMDPDGDGYACTWDPSPYRNGSSG